MTLKLALLKLVNSFLHTLVDASCFPRHVQVCDFISLKTTTLILYEVEEEGHGTFRFVIYCFLLFDRLRWRRRSHLCKQRLVGFHYQD